MRGTKPYEISLWEDVLTYVSSERDAQGKYKEYTSENLSEATGQIKTQYFKERKVCVLGSNSMTAEIRARKGELVRKINGSTTLSFMLYTNFYDSETGELVKNPFVSLLANEKKIKLHYGEEWLDFIIKDIKEDSISNSFVYTAQDIYTNELTKSGFNIEFDPELQNNTGTAKYLGGKVLEESDWQIEKGDIIRQWIEEPLYEITVQTPITGKDMLNPEKVIRVSAGEKIYGFYSIMNEANPYFQFVPAPTVVPSDFLLNSDTNYFIEDMRYNGEVPYFAKTCILSQEYRGKRLARVQEIRYDPAIKKYVKVYTDKKGKEVYGYSDTDYISPAVVQSYITNGFDFNSRTGWEAGSTRSQEDVRVPSTIEPVTYPDVRDITGDIGNYDFQNYLKFMAVDPDHYLFNSGITDHRSSLKSLTRGEQYTFRIQVFIPSSYNGANRPNSLVPFQGTINFQIASYEIVNGAYVLDKIYFRGTKYTHGDVDGQVKISTICSNSASQVELSTGKIGIFIRFTSESASSFKEFFIKKVEFFPYKTYEKEEPEGSGIYKEYECFPGGDITPTLKTQFYYYYPMGENVWKGNLTSPPSAPKAGWIYYDTGKRKTFIYNETTQKWEEFNGESQAAENLIFLYKGYVQSSDYEPKFNGKDFEKVRSIKASESNRFNLLQNICELFECWCKFRVEHNPDTGEILLDNNYRQKKWVGFYNYIGKQNDVGFKYGINLKAIQRQLDSNGIISKIIVKNNANEFAKNGFCSIARAPENYCGENFIFDFSYYIRQGDLSFAQLNNDLYLSVNGYMGYYKQLKQLNKNRARDVEEATHLSEDISNYEAAHQTNSLGLANAEEQLKGQYGYLIKLTGFSLEELLAASHSGDPSYYKEELQWLQDKECQKVIASIGRLKSSIKQFKKLKEKSEEQLNGALARKEALNKRLKETAEAKRQLNQKFYSKYSRFIQEGSWIDENYVDDNLYFIDAQAALHQSSQPKVTYTIDVLELSQLEGYENYAFALGDKTYIEDTKFFGWNNIDGSPFKEEIVVNEIQISLDSPAENKIKVQNYKSEFEDLFQRITATTQSVEFNTGEYKKVSGIISPDGTLLPSTLQNSLANNSLKLENAKDQSVTWDETGITTTSLTKPNEIVRIISGGIFLSIDGGRTWTTGVTGAGINASSITNGQLNTSEVNIMCGAFPSFRWDAVGLNAYRFTVDAKGKPTSYSTSNFIRFDQYGLYGIKGQPNFNPTIPDGENSEIVGEEKIKKYSDFSLTWAGFQIRSRHSDGSKGYVSITSEDDITVLNDEGKVQVKLGYLGVASNATRLYGLRLNDAAGKVTLETGNDGKVWIKNTLKIGEETSTVRLGVLPEKKVSTIYPDSKETYQVFNANDKFLVYDDGSMEAIDGSFKGHIEATSGKIGNLTISQVETTVNTTRSLTLKSDQGFVITEKMGEFYPAQITIRAVTQGLTDPRTYRWEGSSNFEQWELLGDNAATYTFSYQAHASKFLNGSYFIRAIVTAPEGEYTEYETVKVVSDGVSPVIVMIENMKGDFFINGDIKTQLRARVFQENIEITDQFADVDFSWEKRDENGKLDEDWTTQHQNYGKTVMISHLEVDRKAKFTCILNIE